MFLRYFHMALLSLALSAIPANGDEVVRAADLLEWPPAFESLFGDLKIVAKRVEPGRERVIWSGVGSYGAYDGFRRSSASARITCFLSDSSPSSLAEEVAEASAIKFYRRVLAPERRTRYERLLQMNELIELDEAQFVSIASRRLRGMSAGKREEDAWWNVRMGVAGEIDPQRHLVIVNLQLDFDGEKENFGHFSLGVREKGGNPDGDRIYDFRAPWFEDRRTRVTEAVNLHEKLQLSAFSEYMYDWLYTQTEYRGCYVNLWFVPITRDQVVLLNHFSQHRSPQAAGSFRPFRKNCASLGLLFFDRIRPVSDRLIAARPISADLPRVAARKVVEKFDVIAFYRLTNVTDELGREATTKSFVHKAQPTRRESRSFQNMTTVPEIN